MTALLIATVAAFLGSADRLGEIGDANSDPNSDPEPEPVRSAFDGLRRERLNGSAPPASRASSLRE